MCMRLAPAAVLMRRRGLAQIGLAKRIVYSGDLPSQPPPVNSDDPTSAAYRAQVDQVLELSANLTQVTKLQVRAWCSPARVQHHSM